MDRRTTQVNESFVADDLAQMSVATHYNDWLYSMLRPYLGGAVLEVGPGIGNITRLLLADDKKVGCIEPNMSCRQILERDFGNQLAFLCDQTVEACAREQFAQFGFDTIICMNVMEHIEDDLAVFKKYHQWLETGGRLLLLVPAVPWISGTIDDAVGHYRRYSKGSLRKSLQQAQFSIDKIFYSNLIGMVGWFYNSRILKITEQRDGQISMFDNLVPLIKGIEQVIPPPIGMSLIAICTKE